MRESLRLTALVAVIMIGCVDGTDDVPDAGSTDTGVSAQCPTHLRFRLLEGNRTDIGWTGNSHGSTFARDAFFRVQVTQCDESCERCAFEGPVRDPVVRTQRCVADTAVECTADTDCPNWECRDLPGDPLNRRVCANDANQFCNSSAECGPSWCRFFIGPPFPILAPRTCLGTYLDTVDSRPPVFGTIDFTSGSVVLERLRVVTGATDSSVPGACPKCINDTTPNDGQKDGDCIVNNVAPAFPYSSTQKCDANGVGSPALFDGNYSLDCSTPLGVRIELGVEDGRTSGRRIQLTANQPVCNGEPCWCGVCQDSFIGCYDDSDCPGTECVAPTDIPARPNACIDTCQWNPEASRGTCMTQDPLPDGGFGPPRPTACFPEGLGAEIIAPGSSQVLSPTSFAVRIGHVACRSPVRGVIQGIVGQQTDIAVGLPGLQLNVLRFQIDQEFE